MSHPDALCRAPGDDENAGNAVRAGGGEVPEVALCSGESPGNPAECWSPHA
jgi:hypothetical protein